MENAKNSFEQFINDIIDLYHSAYESYDKNIKKPGKIILLKTLFGSESIKGSVSLQKINYKDRFLTYQHLENFIEKIIDEEEDSKWSFLPIPVPVSKDEEYLPDDILCEKLYKKFECMIPFYRVTGMKDLSTIKEETEQYAFHILLYLILYRLFRCTKMNFDIYKIKTPSEEQFNDFSSFICNKKRVIFNGYSCSGKTTFLKQYTNQHLGFVFYLDSEGKAVSRTDIFNTLRSDLKFWYEKDINNKKDKYKEILVPKINDVETLDNKEFYSLLSREDILIIDHVNNLEMMKELEDYPCKIIFVVNQTNNQLPKEITYFFNNKTICKKILDDSYYDMCKEMLSIACRDMFREMFADSYNGICKKIINSENEVDKKECRLFFKEALDMINKKLLLIKGNQTYVKKCIDAIDDIKGDFNKTISKKSLNFYYKIINEIRLQLKREREKGKKGRCDKAYSPFLKMILEIADKKGNFPTTIEDGIFKKLYNDLGYNCVLYRCIEACHKRHIQLDFIKDLTNVNSFDDYGGIFEHYKKVFSLNVNRINNNSNKEKCGKLSSGDQLGKHIVQIYSGVFNDIQNKKDHTENLRDELQILRLFCRLKEENVSLSQLRRYLHDKTFYNHLYELNWINGEEIVIPSIVAFAFNRKELRDESYTYYLRFIEKVLDSFEYDTLYYVDRSTFHSFFKILINDYEKYASIRKKTVNKIRIGQKVDDVIPGYSARIIKRIYETGIWYSFKYNDKDLYDFIMTQAKKLDDLYEWKWFISFWELIQPVEKPINRYETVLPYLNNKNEKILDPHSIYFVNVYNIKLTNIDIINFFQGIFIDGVLMKDRDSDNLNKLFEDMEFRFIHAYCCTNVFNIIGKKNIEGILKKNLKKMECFWKTLFCVYQFIANILSEKEFQSPVRDLMCEYRKMCMNSTILLQAYLILVCSTIFKHKKYDIDIQLLTKDLKLCCNYLGDLPNNINEIVKITRSYLEALDV